MSDNILSVKDLRTSFTTDNGEVMAVNGISFNLDKGKILGIVGESGSGKSVTAYSIMRILESNGSIKGGQVLYKGEDVTKFSEKKMREFRGSGFSYNTQDFPFVKMCIRDSSGLGTSPSSTIRCLSLAIFGSG